MASLSAFWNRLVIGTKLRLTVIEPCLDNIVLMRTIVIKQVNGFACVGKAQREGKPDHTAAEPVWYYKPAAQVCDITETTLLDHEEAEYQMKWEILPLLTIGDIVTPITDLPHCQKGKLGEVVKVDGDNITVDHDGVFTVGMEYLRKVG